MGNWGSGFITIIIYATGGSDVINSNGLLTEASDDLLTEDGKFILIEAA